MTTYSYTAADGTAVDPVASVVNGVATVDVYFIVTEGLHDLRSLWARAGQAVSADRLADVARHAIGTRGNLTGTLATAADIVQATAAATRFLPLGAAAGTIRGANNLGSDIVLIDAQGTETIGGGTAAYQLVPGAVVKFISDGAGGWTDVSGTGADSWLRAWAASVVDNPLAVTRDANGNATSATVAWPDGVSGTYTATTINTTWNAVDAYTVTYAPPGGTTKTITQTAVTRDATTGAVTVRPAMTVA